MMKILHQFDHYDHRILAALQHDARISMAALGRQVGMSQPAVAERVRKLEDCGAITGYRAVVNPEALGYHIRAVVRIGGQTPSFDTIAHLIQARTEIINAYNVTGEDSWVMEIAVADVRHLDEVVSQFSDIAETSTSIILRVIKSDVVLQPPLAEDAG